MYDSFSELIQNAMDAVDKMEKSTNDKIDYQKKLFIKVDLSENSFSITDNGVGFNEKEFESFLAPNISFKDSKGNTRGNKGVGATYIGYGFDYLQFGTKGNGHSFVGELKSGRDWVEDQQGIITRPVVNNSRSDDLAFSEINRGSTFKIKFGGTNTRPKDLSWYGATTPEQWKYLFLLKTPLGAIDYLSSNDNSNIKFDITVIDKNGTEKTITDNDAKYIYPHDKIRASVNLKDIFNIQKNLLHKEKILLKYLANI